MESKFHPRKSERISVAIEGQFSILIPEATFQPIHFPCVIRDLSERGAMVEVNLNNETYRMLLQKTRFCRLVLPAGHGLPDRVVGRSVWIQPEGKGDDLKYKIGLFFEDCPAAIVEQLRGYLQYVRDNAPVEDTAQ
jgi:hypothetical protein